MKRLKQWFRGLSTTGKITSVAVASILSFGTIGALAQPGTPTAVDASPTGSPTQQAKPAPKVTTKTVTSTESIPYTSSTIEDGSLDQGVTETRVVGANGVRTIVHEVTLTDGVETARKEVSNTTTTAAVNEVIAKGTKQPQPQPPVQAPSEPSCPNGTYVNTYGNTVCSPYSSNTAPAGASAQCNDGTYSFSQSRRGTCSGHGGVDTWL